MNFCKSLEYFDGILSNYPFYTFLNSASISFALNGGFCAANSYNMHPRLHISELML